VVWQPRFYANRRSNRRSTFNYGRVTALGTLGRNTFIGPGYINTDFSAIKKTHIPWFIGKEGAQMEFRAEFFNFFNNVNLTSPNGTLNSGNFGFATGTFPARDIQFGLRIEF